MNYETPQLRALLAGEYVLGTLRGSARDRFKKLLMHSTVLRNEVNGWEAQLNGLADGLSPQTPHPRVLEKIKQRISPDQVSTSEPNNFWGNISFWRSLAFAACLSLVFFVTTRYEQVDDVPMQTIAVLHNETSKPVMLAMVQSDDPALVIETIRDGISMPGKSLEVWCISQKSDKPMSLGVLTASKRTVLPLTDEQMGILKQAQAIAVSVEPEGGSPTGLPTGEVMYQGNSI